VTINVLLHTPEAASARLGGVKTAHWLRAKARAGLIDCTRMGQTISFSEANLEKLIRDGFQAAQPVQVAIRPRRRTTPPDRRGSPVTRGAASRPPITQLKGDQP
jgi:hypothetical protein